MGFGLGKEHSTFPKIPSRALMLLLRARMLRRALLSCHVTLLVRGGGGWCAQISMETRTSYDFPIKGAEKRPPQHDIPLRTMKSYHHLIGNVS